MSGTTIQCRDGKLLPCPFCGGEAKMTARYAHRGIIGFVQCQFCEAQTRAFTITDFDPDTFDDPGFEKAAIRWQRRDLQLYGPEV